MVASASRKRVVSIWRPVGVGRAKAGRSKSRCRVRGFWGSCSSSMVLASRVEPAKRSARMASRYFWRLVSSARPRRAARTLAARVPVKV